MGDVERRPGQDEGDDEKDPGIAGDADTDYPLLVVESAWTR